MLEGISKLHTFDQWTNQDWQGANTLIGFFCTWSKDWATMPAAQWKDEPWHAFGAVLRSEGNSVELLIWDPASADRLSKTEKDGLKLDALIDIQQKLFRHCARNWNVIRVWLGGANVAKVILKMSPKEGMILMMKTSV